MPLQETLLATLGALTCADADSLGGFDVAALFVCAQPPSVRFMSSAMTATGVRSIVRR